MKHIDSSSTVDKALKLLLTLSSEGGELGTTELGKLLGIHKATVSRLLMKLAEHEFVYKSKENRKYGLGPAIHQLAMTMSDSNFKLIKHIASPHIDELRDDVKETVALEIWLGNSTVPTYCALPEHPLKIIPPPGEPLALHAAAGAKAILSFTIEERVNQLLDGELTKITQNTMTDQHQFKQSLAKYFKQGYAIDNEEFHTGICAIATPIFNRFRQPIAAIVILMPATRSEQMLDLKIITKLKHKSALISKQLAMKTKNELIKRNA